MRSFSNDFLMNTHRGLLRKRGVNIQVCREDLNKWVLENIYIIFLDKFLL